LWVISRFVNGVAEGSGGLFPDLEMKWQKVVRGISRFVNEVAEGSCGIFPDLETEWQKVVGGYFQI
jgi:hypothetical protein